MALTKAIKYFHQYYLSPGFGREKYTFPTHVNFPITDNCNSKCRMCNVWKDKSENELLPDEIRTLFSNKLFKKVKHLGISGGEPTLRKDLIECISAILVALPNLTSLSITTHGFHPTKWKKLLPQISQLCKEKDILLKLNVSVDGIGDLHEEVRRVEGGWEKVQNSIVVIKECNVPLQIQCTVSKHNVFGVNEVLHYAKKNNIEYIFRKATSINRLYNQDITSDFFTSNHGDSFFADFIESKSVNDSTDNPGRKLFYKDLAKRLVSGSKRVAPCHFKYNGVLISAHGEMFHCSIDEHSLGNCRKEDPYQLYFSKASLKQLEDLTQNICPNCLHDQTGAWNPFDIIWNLLKSKIAPLKKGMEYLNFGIKNINFKLGGYKRKVIINKSISSHNIHIVGAYGGEHVGDSAILGGVIIRVLKRHPSIDKIIVYSKRADRTLFWIKGLDFEQNVNIEVRDYGDLNDIEVSKNDKLVWAGGPIMEMPVDLFEHFTTIRSFVRSKIEFEIIGCGWGPFKTKYSIGKAQKILESASYIEMRDEYDLPVTYHQNQDPAFDYLYQHKNDIEKWSWSRNKINEFVKTINPNKENKLILLNLRPLWGKYNKSNISSGELDNKIIDTVFEAIKKLPKNHIMVSVPFNTDHYGFSDMEPALSLLDKCKEAGVTNYKVFNRELDARDMIYFLQHFDAGVCMRFHACIFLKSQGIPVYGIDYTAGEIGKVGGLFNLFGDSNWSNIVNLQPDELISFIGSYSSHPHENSYSS